MPIVGLRIFNTPDGVLKLLHVVLGAASLLLLSFSYVKFWALDLFLITIAVCFGVSTLNLILHCLFRPNLLRSRPTKFLGSFFHIIAGACLIIAGIDLIGWSEYDQHCGFKCPRIYYIGVAKILTFINGTLYGIHGFLEMRGEDEEDFLGESLPLLSPQVVVHPPTPTPPSTTDNIDHDHHYDNYTTVDLYQNQNLSPTDQLSHAQPSSSHNSYNTNAKEVKKNFGIN